MLRSLLIYLSKAGWARNIVTNWGVAWRVASRFISGETIEDAFRIVRQLNAKGINATLDHLGEHTTNIEEAVRSTDEIIGMLDAIKASGVRSNISIKLTQIGLQLDEQMCGDNLHRILEHARHVGTFVRIDMEDSPWVDATIRIYCRMRDQYNLENTGMVFQSYLYRTEADMRKLSDSGIRVRLCKGAYKEPADVAFPKKADVDHNYDRLADLLIDSALQHGAPPVSSDGLIPPIPAIASHDPARIQHAREYASRVNLPKSAIEFQMLNGIRRDLQEQLAADGYPVRVYIPFGTEWYQYFMRRLAERPANLWFFVSNFFRR